MAIELKEGMTLVCKTANGKTFKVGEKYPVIKSDNGDLYIKTPWARWFNYEMEYLEASGDTFEVLPYTPDLSNLKEVECVAEDQDAWSFVKGKKYKVHHDECEPYILSDKGARFRQENLEHLAKHYDVRFDEPKQEPVTELKTGATLICTSNDNGGANYFTVGKKYPVIRATRFNGNSENCIESDTGTKWWNNEVTSLLNCGLVFHEYKGEEPKTLIPPHDRPYQAGDVLKMTATRTYWTKDREYQIYEDAKGLYVLDDDYWDKGQRFDVGQRYLTDSLRDNVLIDMKFVKHVEETKFKHSKAKVEQPEPEFNYTVKAANLKELNAVLYSAYQYTQTMLETNDKLEDYQREHDIAKENLEDLLK